MANYLYNGVELPDINTVWTDKEKYPYCFIAEFGSSDDLLLYCSSNPLRYNPDKNNVYTQGYTYYATYRKAPGSTEWTAWGSATSSTGPSWYPAIWSNSDIISSDGTVYLAGSDPVDPNAPTSSYDELSFKIGLALGLCGKGVPKLDGGSDSSTYTWNAEDGWLDTCTATIGGDTATFYKMFNVTSLPTSTGVIGTVISTSDGTEIVATADNVQEVVEGIYSVEIIFMFVYDSNNEAGIPTGVWISSFWESNMISMSPITLTLP